MVVTAGPGTVKAAYDIDLPRPHGSVQEIRFQPRFLELHRRILESLREEVERAYSRNGAGHQFRGRTLMRASPCDQQLEALAAIQAKIRPQDPSSEVMITANARLRAYGR